MKKYLIFILTISLLVLISCNKSHNRSSAHTDCVANAVDVAKQQIGFQVKLIEDSGRFINPRTVVDGVISYVPDDDWTSGFFPGTMFYMYDLTKDKKWLDYGVKYTETLDSVKYLKSHHDVGFMIKMLIIRLRFRLENMINR